jgi:hypothetical protein
MNTAAGREFRPGQNGPSFVAILVPPAPEKQLPAAHFPLDASLCVRYDRKFVPPTGNFAGA